MSMFVSEIQLVQIQGKKRESQPEYSMQPSSEVPLAANQKRNPLSNE